MSDVRVRKAYRRWQSTGDPRDEAAWIHERLRAGLDPERLRVASLLNHPAAVLLMPREEASDHPAIRHLPEDDPPGQHGATMSVLCRVVADMGYDGRVVIGSAASVDGTAMTMHAIARWHQLGLPERDRWLTRVVDLARFLPNARRWLRFLEEGREDPASRLANEFVGRFYLPVHMATQVEQRIAYREACGSLLSLVEFVGSEGPFVPHPVHGTEWPDLPELCAFNAYVHAVNAWEEWFQSQRGDDFETARRVAHERVLDHVRREVIPWLFH